MLGIEAVRFASNRLRVQCNSIDFLKGEAGERARTKNYSDFQLATRQRSFELLLSQTADDRTLLTQYFELLTEISRAQFGLIDARLPTCRFPLYLRGMTSDVFNLRQIFERQEYEFGTVPAPRRILDLGAYVGYAAVWFANRFPEAEIVCVEPSPANFRMLLLNTAPYERIRLIQGAVWDRSAVLDIKSPTSDGLEAGAWALQTTVASGEHQRQVVGYSVTDLLQMVGWSGIDFLKCDIEGAECEVFRDAAAPIWLSETNAVAIELHDRFRSGCDAAVYGVLSEAEWRRGLHGEFATFTRRTSPPPPPHLKAVPIILQPGRTSPCRFTALNVGPEIWSLWGDDEETFRLHPNPPGAGAAELLFQLDLKGHDTFSTTAQLPRTSAGNVIFGTRLATKENETIVHDSRLVRPGKSIDWCLHFERRHGRCDLSMSTEMAPAAESNAYAWATFSKTTIR